MTDSIDNQKDKKSNKKIIIVAISILILVFFCVACYFLNIFLESPLIEIKGEKEMTINVGENFTDPGAKATLKDLDISNKIKTQGTVDTNKIGTYTIQYLISNTRGKNTKTITREVKVIDTQKPQITLTKGTVTIGYKENYKEPGYKATDNYDGDITKNVKVEGTVNSKKLGTYELSYLVQDSSGNQTIIKRKVKVVDNKAPTISLKGSNKVVLNVNQSYKEAGYTATDDYDGNVTSKVKVSKSINTSRMGVYEVTYTVTDKAGNRATKTRIVQVGTQQEIDEKNYVLVSIVEQKAWYYKNGKLVTSGKIVTGQKGSHDTPKGKYRILSKARSVTLRGPGYQSYVNYWMLYDKKHQIGLHDATWRSSFGGTIYKSYGSHGCVNMPYSVAQKIYNSIEIGTAVVVY